MWVAIVINTCAIGFLLYKYIHYTNVLEEYDKMLAIVAQRHEERLDQIEDDIHYLTK